MDVSWNTFGTQLFAFVYWLVSRTYTYTRTRARARAHTHTHALTHMHTQMHSHTHAHLDSRTCGTRNVHVVHDFITQVHYKSTSSLGSATLWQLGFSGMEPELPTAYNTQPVENVEYTDTILCTDKVQYRKKETNYKTH